MPAELRSEEVLHKISVLADELSSVLAEVVFSDGVRTYDMSKLASEEMIPVIQTPDGKTKKDVDFDPEPGMLKTIVDKLGNTISIKEIGRIKYRSDPSADDYVYAFRVSKHRDDNVVMPEITVYSNIDMNDLDNEEYRSIVANTLLTNNNIELSQADGYIGEIYEQSTLNDGEESFVDGFYTYQIPHSGVHGYALVYEGTKIEAVRAGKEDTEKYVRAYNAAKEAAEKDAR